MKIGCHVSIAGGIENAPERAHNLGCETFQIFARSPRGGGVNIRDEQIKKFKTDMEKYGFDRFYVHAPYYINLASTNKRIYHGSIAALRRDLEDGSRMGARALMTHLGSAKDVGKKKALDLVAQGIKKILDDYKGTCQFLIEISAGSGSIIGDTFEEVANIIRKVGKPTVGVCFDTQHAFASGYDVRTKAAIYQTFKEFNTSIGLDRLILSHVNDSKSDFGSHVDRHEDLGKGLIGKEAFEEFVQYSKREKLDLIVETPTGGEQYKREITLLKKFREALSQTR